MESLSNIKVALVEKGAIVGPYVEAGSIWNENPTLIFVSTILMDQF